MMIFVLKLLKEIEEESFKDRPDCRMIINYLILLMMIVYSDDEVLKWWADHAFTYGFSQEEFAEGLEK